MTTLALHLDDPAATARMLHAAATAAVSGEQARELRQLAAAIEEAEMGDLP